MSITKITDPAAVPAAVSDYQAQNELTQSALTGLAKITLSEYDTDAVPAVKVGSVFNVGGITYSVSTADETPSGYAGIAVSTTFYLYFDAGTELFVYSSTAPVWNDAYQGWYNSDDRAFFSMYKDATGLLYELKTALRNPNVMENIEIGNNLSIGGSIIPTNTPISGGQAITAGSNWVVPQGIYAMALTSTWLDLQIYVSGAWRSAETTGTNACVISDGTNVRVYNSSGTITVYYLKF